MKLLRQKVIEPQSPSGSLGLFSPLFSIFEATRKKVKTTVDEILMRFSNIPSGMFVMHLAQGMLKNLYSRREIWVLRLLLALGAGGGKIRLPCLLKPDLSTTRVSTQTRPMATLLRREDSVWGQVRNPH